METGIPSQDPQAILFRPSKKRKIYRQRITDDSESPFPAPAESAAPAPIASPDDAEIEVESTQVSMAEILRLRKLRKHKLGGVEFRAATPMDLSSTSAALIAHNNTDAMSKEEEQDTSGGVVRRFAKQTGMVGDVDRHMMAYIDSELAKRRQPPVSSSNAHSATTTVSPTVTSASKDLLPASKDKDVQTQRQPAALGKLMEIDLGNEARDRNVARTEQARRRLHGGEEPEEQDSGPPKKPRLGRDGKPWRGRNRRGSDDIKRDLAVEEVLRENRLEIYEPPPPQSLRDDEEEDEGADERIAEAFRRDFMDAVSARQRKKPVVAAPTRSGPGAKKEEELKGPKLGGSRSARAAMREVLLKAGKK